MATMNAPDAALTDLSSLSAEQQQQVMQQLVASSSASAFTGSARKGTGERNIHLSFANWLELAGPDDTSSQASFKACCLSCGCCVITSPSLGPRREAPWRDALVAVAEDAACAAALQVGMPLGAYNNAMSESHNIALEIKKQVLPSFIKDSARPALPPLPTHAWRIPNMMSFENVGVSKPGDFAHLSMDTEGSQSNAPARRFLSCADCDVGPIGLIAADGMHWLYADRVDYFVQP
jgi:hypothetical protein